MHTLWRRLLAGQPSGVASPEIGGGQKIGGEEMFDFRRITLFCFENLLSKYKITTSWKKFRGHGPFGPPWLRLCLNHRWLCVDWCKTTRTKDIVNIFQKESVVWLDDCHFWECLFTQYVEQKANSLWMAKSEKTGYSFLALIKNTQTLLSKFQLQTFVV